MRENATPNKPKLFVKFSPDEDLKIYADMIELINSIEIDRVIVSNTTNDSDLKTVLAYQIFQAAYQEKFFQINQTDF